jgi:hypothetical protein
MRFEIPLDKDSQFAMDFFSLIDRHVSELATDHQKLPSQIIFSGGLGKELHSFIKDKGWSFSGFELIETHGPNQLVFKYSKELDQVEMNGGIQMNDPGFDGKMVEGVLGQETVSKIMSGYLTGGFKIERKVRPEKRINLIRKR